MCVCKSMQINLTPDARVRKSKDYRYTCFCVGFIIILFLRSLFQNIIVN